MTYNESPPDIVYRGTSNIHLKTCSDKEGNLNPSLRYDELFFSKNPETAILYIQEHIKYYHKLENLSFYYIP